MYADHGWQKGSYEKVFSKSDLSPGETYSLEFKIIQLGEFSTRIVNNSSDSIYVESYVSNQFVEFLAHKGSLIGNSTYDKIEEVLHPAGINVFKWRISHPNGVDTIVTQEDLVHGEHTVVELVYPQ
jgi:hypothetical protein